MMMSRGFVPVVMSVPVIVAGMMFMCVRMIRKENDALHGAEKRFPVEAEIEHRSQEHISGDTGETVEIKCLHDEETSGKKFGTGLLYHSFQEAMKK
jgi:hypothetical protein